MKTTRQHFCAALALLARLHKAAQSCGDTRRAQRYAIAVEVLLDAWPSGSDGESDLRAFPLLTPEAWSEPELTLLGLGVVRESESAGVAGQDLGPA